MYRSDTVNSNTVNSKFHFVRSFCEMFSYHFMFNFYFHLFQRKSLPMKDFELIVPDRWLGSIGGSKRGWRRGLVSPHWGSKSFHFHAVLGKKIGKNIHSGNSCIRNWAVYGNIHQQITPEQTNVFSKIDRPPPFT